MTSKKFMALLVLAACSFLAAAELDVSKINVNDLQQQLPAELANTNITLDDIKSIVKDKCVQNTDQVRGETAFADIETATMGLGDCITTLVNISTIQEEIEAAKPKGELDVVFNSYCKKRPQALECVETFNDKLKPCLDKEEQENQDVFMRIIKSLLNFICYKGGDQIALFIAEKGPECLESKRDDIQQCLNDTLTPYMPKDGLQSVKTLPKFVMGIKQCEDMEKLEKCIVKKLEDCEEITPANIVESMFRFVKNETICNKSVQTAKQTGVGNNGAAGQNAATLQWGMLLMIVGFMFKLRV